MKNKSFLLLAFIFSLVLAQGGAVLAVIPEDLNKKKVIKNTIDNESGLRELKDGTEENSIKKGVLKHEQKVNFYKTSKKDFLDAKEKFKKNKAENKELFQERASIFSENSINEVINHLEAIKNKTKNASNISEKDRAKILSEIEEDIKWLELKKSELERSSAEEIMEIAKEVRQYLKETRSRTRQIVGHMMAYRINDVILKSKEVEGEISKLLKNLQEDGEDITKLQELLKSFNKNIELAQEKYEDAKDCFDSMPSENNFSALFKNGHYLIKESHQYIKAALKDLKEIAKDLRAYKDKKVIISSIEMPISYGNDEVIWQQAYRK